MLVNKYGFDLNNTNNYVDCGYISSFDNNRYSSVSTWLKPNGNNITRIAYTVDYLNPYSSGFGFFTVNGILGFRISWVLGGGSCYMGGSTINTIDNTKLTHIYMCIDAQAKSGDVYIDGVFFETVVFSVLVGDIIYSENVIRNESQPLWIGAQQDTSILYSNGVISELKAYNKCLTPSEIVDEMQYEYNANNAIGYWSLNQNTIDSSGNGNDGIVIGTEQYAIIGSYCVCGELFERKETESFASTDYYKWDITDWVYGGSFTIDVNVTGNKTIKTWLFYDEDDKAYVYNSQTTTAQQITVDLPDTEARSMIIEVISDNNFSSITYAFEHIAPIVIYDESISVGVSTYDTTVNYANNQTLSETESIRINKEDSNLFKTIVENNLYFMGKERAVLSYNFSELDTTRYMFDLSLTRLL